MKLLSFKCSGQARGAHRRPLGMLLTFAVAFFMMTVGGLAQSLTTGALSGTITDPSGATIPGAKVTATSIATGAVHSTQSQANGSYLIPLLEPGQYIVTIEKTGFQTAKQVGIGVAVSTNGTANFKLTVGASTQTVEVTSEAPLLQPQNANTTTTLDTKAIENLPNPGGDITMLAQIAPGASMNVHGGGGTAGLNFNGIQGNAVEYTQDGMDVNDPFNNDNNSGASNMLLGQNSVSEVTVNTNAYSVDQGRMAAGQVNYLSKGGSNSFHGDAQWQWNGRALNANDFFNNLQGAPRSFDNVNNWAAGVGGYIVKNKLFFFADSEGTRIDLPNAISYKVPTPAFLAYAQQQVTLGGFDPTKSLSQVVGGTRVFRNLPAAPNQAAFQKQIIGLYGNTAVGVQGASTITRDTNKQSGCNLDPSFVTAQNPLGVDPSYNPQLNPSATNVVPSDTGCTNFGQFSGAASTPEEIASLRLDYNLNANNTIWGKYLDDRGLQTTGVNPINSVFNEDSNQPQRQGVLDWTHVFTPTLTNDASTGFLWYSAIFDFNTPLAEHAAINGLGRVSTPFNTFGSTSFPQGRNVTQYQAIDNLTWTRGSHSFKFGENFRRELVNDHHFSEDFASSNTGDFAEMEYAAANVASQNYPISSVEQFKSFSLDLYAGDTWQATRNITVTYGVRATHNSNPVDKQPFEGNFADFNTFTHANLNGGNLATPPNANFDAQNQLWSSVPAEVWQPRFSVAWQPRTNTLIKAGWGMFSQVATTSAAETLANNPPFNPNFIGGFAVGNLGANGSPAGCTQAGGANAQCGFGWDPTQPGSAVGAAQAANAAFQANFKGGNPSCAFTGPSLTCVPPANISALPAAGLIAPMVYQYNLTAQQAVGKSMSFSVGYVGSHQQHNSFTMGDNGFQNVCAGCFSPYLFGVRPDPRFISYNQTRYDGYGNYNALQAAFVDRLSHGLTLNLNYTYSHCMTTGTPYADYNGGNSLRNVYDDCTNDITNVVNASYTYSLPVHASGFAGKFVNGWQVSGATFSQGGVPLFLGSSDGNTNSPLSGFFANRSGPLSGYLISGNAPYAKNVNIAGVTASNAYQWLNPSAIGTIWDGSTGQCVNPSTQAQGLTPALCQFNGNNGTNLRGPTFQWTNLDVAKNIQLTERVNLRLDFQGYNVFNHPNFANPDTTGNTVNTISNGNDAITSMTAPNNGLLGQNGGDSAPRMLAFQAKIVF